MLVIRIVGKASEVFTKIKTLGALGKRLQIDELARLYHLKMKN
jgi:hypothetical protein